MNNGMNQESNELLQHNLHLWAELYPKEAIILPYLDDGGLEYCLTSCGEDNLCRQGAKGIEFVQRQSGAQAEADEWFASLNLKGVKALYVYGIGLGYYYTAAKEWLEGGSERALLFLEDDLHIIQKLLERPVATALMQDPQVQIIYLPPHHSGSPLLGELHWDFAFMKPHVSALKYYAEAKSSNYAALAHEVNYHVEIKRGLIEEYLNFGKGYFANFYRNILQLPQAYLGNHLFGKFGKVPAIICGAGPSLEKQLPMLQQLQERALILAGGSAINVLTGAAIQPHLGVAIDPNSAQEVRLRHMQAYETPFFYRNRLNHDALKLIHGPRLYVTGSAGYNIAEYFEQACGIVSDDFDEGHNVVNFCVELAYRMGCDPIIFVGMDLALTDQKLYSGGVEVDATVEMAEGDLLSGAEKEGLRRIDINGNEVCTLWKWVAEAEWLGRWAVEHPDVKLVNCTEGGIGFPPVANRRLADLAAETQWPQVDLLNRLFVEMQECRLTHISEAMVREAMAALRESLERCHGHLDILRLEAQALQAKIGDAEGQPISLQPSGLAALAEVELADEVAYGAVLDVFNAVVMRLLQRECRLLQQKVALNDEKGSQLTLVELHLKRLNFLHKLVKVHLLLIDYALSSSGSNGASRECPAVETADAGKPLTTAALHAEEASGIEAAPVERSGEELFYSDGFLQGVIHWNGSQLDGPIQYYSREGVSLVKGEYVAGQLQGALNWYYPSGKVYSVQHFNKGMRHGKQQFFYENGQLKSNLEYSHGQLVNQVRLYSDKGDHLRTVDFSGKVAG